MPNSLNIGLVGSGFMGQAHTDAYRRAGILYRNLPRKSVLYAIADQNESLAESARRKLGFAKAYGGWQRLVEIPMSTWSILPPRTIHPNRIGLSVFAISVCKNPIRKAIYTEIAKIAQERTTTNRKGHPIRIVLCDLCDLCVSKSDQKGVPHGDRKDRAGTDDHESNNRRGRPNRIGLSDLCDLRV